MEGKREKIQARGKRHCGGRESERERARERERATEGTITDTQLTIDDLNADWHFFADVSLGVCARLQAFVGDLSKMMGRPIEVAEWSTSTQPGKKTGCSPAAGAAASSGLVPESVEQMKSKVFQANKIGFLPGAFVTFKASEQVQIWKIASLTDTSASLIEQVGGSEGETKEVTTDALLVECKVHKGKVTHKLIGWDFLCSPCSPMQSSAWGLDAAKGAIAIALRTAWKKHFPVLQHVELLQHPTTVKIKKDFKAETLILIPASSRVDRKAGSGSLCLGEFELCPGTVQALYLASQFVAPTNAAGDTNANAWVAPFWLVGASEKSETPTMELRHEVTKVGDFKVHIPMLVNKKDLKAGNAIAWSKVDTFKTDDGAPAAKRVRKKG